MRITCRERSGGEDETATWDTKIIRGYRKYEHIQQQTRRRMDESSEKVSRESSRQQTPSASGGELEAHCATIVFVPSSTPLSRLTTGSVQSASPSSALSARLNSRMALWRHRNREEAPSG